MVTNMRTERVDFNWMMGIGVGAPYNLPKQTITNSSDHIQIVVVSSAPIPTHPNIIVLSETIIIAPHDSVSFVPRVIRLDSVPPIAQIPGVSLIITVVDVIQGCSCTAPQSEILRPEHTMMMPTPEEVPHAQLPTQPRTSTPTEDRGRRKRRVRLNDNTFVEREEFDRLKNLNDPRTVGVVLPGRWREARGVEESSPTVPSMMPVSELLQSIEGDDADDVSVSHEPSVDDETN